MEVTTLPSVHRACRLSLDTLAANRPRGNQKLAVPFNGKRKKSAQPNTLASSADTNNLIESAKRVLASLWGTCLDGGDGGGDRSLGHGGDSS